MIDQQLLIPTLATSSGAPSITIAELVALMDGEILPVIDQSLLIPTLRGRAGLPAETIADIVALSTGGGGGLNDFVWTRIAALSPSNHWPCNGLVDDAVSFADCGVVSPVSLTAINTPTFANSIPMAAEPLSTATLFAKASEEVGASPDEVGRINTDSIGTALFFFKLTSLAGGDRVGGQGSPAGATVWSFIFTNLETIRLQIAVDGGADSVTFRIPNFDADDGNWHMIAYRQPGIGGMNAFRDGVFFTNAQLTIAVIGSGSVDWWFEDTVVGAADPATIMGLASSTQTTRTNWMDGELMHFATFPTLLTDDDLSGIWDQAIANGLNA